MSRNARSVRFVYHPELNENITSALKEAVAQQDFESLNTTIFLKRTSHREDAECAAYEEECVKYALSLAAQQNSPDQSFLHEILCYDVDFLHLPKSLPFTDNDIEEFKSAFAGVEKRVEFLVSEFANNGNTKMLDLFMNYPQEVELYPDPEISKEIATDILLGLPSDYLTQRLKSVSKNKNYNFDIETDITHFVQEGNYEETKELIMKIDSNIDEDTKKSFIQKRFEYACKECQKYGKMEMADKLLEEYFKLKEPVDTISRPTSYKFTPKPPEASRESSS